MSKITIIIISTILCSSILVSGQDIIKKPPRKAAIYSAIIPGAGQVYTQKYWKVPIIYAGLITSIYYIKENNNMYQIYRGAYLNRISGDFSDNLNYSNSQLQTLTNHYRRNREVSILCLIGTYVLNIVDASVSAHLFDYDISEELSLHIQPTYISSENVAGLSLSFNL